MNLFKYRPMFSKPTPIFWYFPVKIVKDLWDTRVKHHGPFVVTWKRLENSNWAQLWIGW